MFGIFFCFLTLLLNSFSGIHSAEVTLPPHNASGSLGQEIKIPCKISSNLIGNEAINFYKYPSIGPRIQLASHTGYIINNTKYGLDMVNRYELIIKDASFSDDGMYECVFTRSNNQQELYKFYLIVSDPPKAGEMYWPGGLDHVSLKGQPVNITCKSDKSRPPATFWFKRNGENITSSVVYYSPPLDNNGYSEAYGYLETMLNFENKDDRYECFIEVPGATPLKKELLVKFSKATILASHSIIAYLSAVLIALKF